MTCSLVTDGFLYGKTLIGETTADLLRWEAWLVKTQLPLINRVQMQISPGKGHEMDVSLLLKYLV